jgi:hypothetical protein
VRYSKDGGDLTAHDREEMLDMVLGSSEMRYVEIDEKTLLID